MIEVEMTDDIRKFETKFLGPFTMRQTICTVVACLYTIPIAIALPMELENKLLVAMLLAAPVIGCGYIKQDGMHLEVLAMRVLYMYFLTPGKRKCKAVNNYKESLKDVKKQNEKEYISSLSMKEQKKYQKQKEKAKKKGVNYKSKQGIKVYR